MTTTSQSAVTQSVSPSSPPSPRILSIDALRGFDMFWIIGGDAFFRLLFGLSGLAIAPQLVDQLEHVDWEGFRFYDLIFPLFMFLVGCSMPFSLEKYRDRPSAVYWRIARRTILLVLIGMIFNGLLDFDWAEMRYPGVLQRIGIGYGCAALICIHTRMRGQILFIMGILLGYWALMALVPAPGYAAGDFSKEGNLAGYVDRTILPGKINPEYYGIGDRGLGDNEGLLSTIPAIATVLLGVIAGSLIRSSARPWSKVAALAVVGVGCLILGQVWGFYFPIIKNLWTSSFVLVAGGWSFLLLALFYAVIDVIGWKSWAFFWVVIGMNAITIYLTQRVVDFDAISSFFLNGTAGLVGIYGPLLLAGGGLLLKWLYLFFLYEYRIFLRL